MKRDNVFSNRRYNSQATEWITNTSLDKVYCCYISERNMHAVRRHSAHTIWLWLDLITVLHVDIFYTGKYRMWQCIQITDLRDVSY